MANDINRVILVGRLTKDIETRYMQNGSAIGRFSLAVSKGKGDNEEVSFFDVKMFGKLIEALQKYLVKGQQVVIDGELKQERWAKDGVNYSRVRVIAYSIQLIGSARRSQAAQPQAQQAPPPPQHNPPKTGKKFSNNNNIKQAPPPFPGPEDFEDDIPF